MSDYERLSGRLSRVRGELLVVAERVPAERWREKPAPEKWSAAEVIAHLTQVEKAIADGMEKLFQTEPQPVPFWKRLHIPPRVSRWRFFRAETPLPLDAGLVEGKAAMLERFAAGRARTLKILDTHRDKDLRRWRFRHPFFGSLNGYAWFKNIYHHEIRHTQQLREIVESLA